ncbi:RING/U-box superfamily protein [Striga asiatica]|uniref:RING-type E3 ubiquitin transferase n=1 Tax=Striga asiatica TaxID=4170 RepID=A0A5A7NX98_STRAF|nr:RING/U-box superfamily protein [Striga asiatica]
MDNLLLLLLLLLLHSSFLLIQLAAAQSQSLDSSNSSNNFQPSLAVVIGMLAVMFSLTFVLLLYAKFCHRPTNSDPDRTRPDPTRTTLSKENGVDKTVIESLPFFPFSTLGGLKQGLDCSVCLSRFDEPDILRLLPGCRHAFHVDCIDRWLHSHSTCPLCRRHVSADDLALIGADVLELYVEREVENNNRSRRLSTRFSSIGRSFRKLFDRREEDDDDEEKQIGINHHRHHKFNHRISFDLMMRSRWSNVSSSDLVLLNDVERKNEFEINDCSSIFQNGEKRSVSEIVVYPRLMNEIIVSSSNNNSASVNEERMRKLWMPIAKKTARWFVNRDKRPTQNVAG